jgi:putative tricarboxylic transport membrane protein
MNQGNMVFSIICLGVSLWLILESSNYNYIVKYTPGPGFFPFWLGVVLALFSTALLIETCIKKGRKNPDEPSRLPGRQVLYRVGLITLLTAGFAILMTSLGFVLSVILFVSGILFFMERVPAVRSVITGLIMSACVYLIFEYWMQIGLPAGFLGF